MNAALTLVCSICNHRDVYQGFIVINNNTDTVVCQNAPACKRRQARDEVAAMTQMSRVDRTSILAISLCAAFMVSVIVTGLAYIWFGI